MILNTLYMPLIVPHKNADLKEARVADMLISWTSETSLTMKNVPSFSRILLLLSSPVNFPETKENWWQHCLMFKNFTKIFFKLSSPCPSGLYCGSQGTLEFSDAQGFQQPSPYKYCCFYLKSSHGASMVYEAKQLPGMSASPVSDGSGFRCSTSNPVR